jgi:hypothetical protein
MLDAEIAEKDHFRTETDNPLAEKAEQGEVTSFLNAKCNF